MTNYFGIIKSAIVTEKSSLLSEKFNKYSLYVALKSNKDQIKKAVKMVFDVDVDKVNTVNIKGKKRRFKGILGRRVHKKKAYFSLVDGQVLSVMKG